MQTKETSRQKKILGTVFVTVLLIAHASCTSRKLEDICAHGFPRLYGQVQTARLALNDIHDRRSQQPSKILPIKEGERRIATEGVSKKETGETEKSSLMTDEEREDWARWARQSLDEVQGYLDAVDPDPNLREIKRLLMNVANRLVHFHGHAEAGDLLKMTLLLDELSGEALDTREKLCGFRVSSSIKTAL